MPDFAFPTVGPLGLGSPPSRYGRPAYTYPRYYAPLRLPIALLWFLRSSLGPRYLLDVRRQWALPSSRVTPLGTCPVLRPRWCPVHSPFRVQDCCLPLHAKRRLSFLLRREVILLSTTIHISRLDHTACTLVPPSFVLPLPGLHVGFPTDLLARL